jgi:hypothetical protein
MAKRDPKRVGRLEPWPAVLLPEEVGHGDACGENDGPEDVGPDDEVVPKVEAVAVPATRHQETVGDNNDEEGSGGEADGRRDVDSFPHGWRHRAPLKLIGSAVAKRAASSPTPARGKVPNPIRPPEVGRTCVESRLVARLHQFGCGYRGGR